MTPSSPNTDAAEAEIRALRAALRNLLNACQAADAAESLPAEVDGSLMDAAREALDLQFPIIWSESDVALLLQRQADPMSHPYTCGGDRSDANHVVQAEEDGDDDTGILIPTRRGWVCPACDYRQFWAHGAGYTGSVGMTSPDSEDGRE